MNYYEYNTIIRYVFIFTKFVYIFIFNMTPGLVPARRSFEEECYSHGEKDHLHGWQFKAK
jgi:hypothetical protein